MEGGHSGVHQNEVWYVSMRVWCVCVEGGVVVHACVHVWFVGLVGECCCEVGVHVSVACVCVDTCFC